MCIYIYIERERERERTKQREREREREGVSCRRIYPTPQKKLFDFFGRSYYTITGRVSKTVDARSLQDEEAEEAPEEKQELPKAPTGSRVYT